MTDETRSASPMGEGSTEVPADPGTPQFASVEEAVAFHRNRQSGIDKAHAAETAELQRQMAALKSQPPVTPEGESPEAARVRELEAALQVERNARQAEALRNQYPNVSSALGDAITNIPAEKLAALEAMAENGQTITPRVDPNAAPRPQAGAPGTAGAKPMNERSKDELLADLARIAPAYQEAAKEGLV
jgi:hypothetical protein